MGCVNRQYSLAPRFEVCRVRGCDKVVRGEVQSVRLERHGKIEAQAAPVVRPQFEPAQVAVVPCLLRHDVGKIFPRHGALVDSRVKSLHAQVRLGQLDRELFLNLRQVNAAISNHAYEYNFKRPHSSLGNGPLSVPAQRELSLRPTACAPLRTGRVPINH